MHPVDRRHIALGASAAGLGLMAAGILADTLYPGGVSGFGKSQVMSMVIGSFAVAWASYGRQDPCLDWGRRIAAGLWLLMGLLGPFIYPGQWPLFLSVCFAMLSALVILGDPLLGFVRGFLATRLAAVNKPGAQARSNWPVPANWMLILSAGLLSGLLCLTRLLLNGGGSGDFHWALSTAAYLTVGRDPYDFVPSPLMVPYPLPVAIFGFPLIWLPGAVAASLFFGLSSALLAFGILRSHSPRRLLLFLGFPFFAAAGWAQWSPLITASWFFPIIAPLLVLVKPQTALPVALNRLTRRGLLLATAVLALSLVIYPQWPWRWLRMIGDYERILPVAMLPLGPVLLLAALFPQDARARLLLLMSLLPLRANYDLVPLFLIPATASQMVALVVFSWLTPLDLVLTGGLDWQQRLNQHHLYALCILFWSNRAIVRASWGRMRAITADVRSEVL